MTADEFFAWYAELEETTVGELRASGLYPKRCHCGEEQCAGWWMAVERVAL